MAVWSSFALKNIVKNLNVANRVLSSLKNVPKGKGVTYIPVRGSHDNVMAIRDSTFVVYKFKDLVYFYFTLGAVPLISIIAYCNIFIGPATLAVIPEGYTPKPWEYHQHPITRFLAKYIVPSPQECYERSLHNLFIDNEVTLIRKLERKVHDLIKERGDYQSWYFAKPEVKYSRRMKLQSEEFEKRSGRVSGWIF